MAKFNKSSRKKSLSREEKEEMDLFDMEQSSKKEAVRVQSEQIIFKPGTDFKTESQKKLYRKIKENKIIFIQGPAGSGKTFATLRTALEILKSSDVINNIIITKPIIEAGGENIGFLPGEIGEKISPYMNSFYSNIQKIIGKQTAEAFLKREFIKEKPLAFVRGETFDNCVCILDEAQNTTVVGLKLFISRFGENAKMIIMGDTDQVDIKLKDNEKSGLQDAFERFKGINGVSFHEFTEDDIVRSSILIDVMKRYSKDRDKKKEDK